MQTSLGAGTKHGGGFYVDVFDSASYDPIAGPGFFYMVWSIFWKKSKDPAFS